MAGSNILNSRELHELGIRIVVNRLQKIGLFIEEVMTEISVNPQIIANYNNEKIFLLVRTACFPEKGQLDDENFTRQFEKYVRNMGVKCYFASLGVRNAYGVTDLEKSIINQNGHFMVDFLGFIELSDLLHKRHENDVIPFYDEKGIISGGVEVLEDGRNVIRANENAGYNSLIMSLFLIFSEDLSDNDRLTFSKWAELPLNSWGKNHKKEFAFSLMHYFMDEKTADNKFTPEVENAISLLNPQTLPPLIKPLSVEVIDIFNGLFGNT